MRSRFVKRRDAQEQPTFFGSVLETCALAEGRGVTEVVKELFDHRLGLNR
jgi:hypothetical protein